MSLHSLCTVGLFHLFNDELAELAELNELLFAGGGADVAYDFLSDLVAVAHRLDDLQDGAVCEFLVRTNMGINRAQSQGKSEYKYSDEALHCTV